MSWFFESVNKIYKPLARPPTKKRETIEINKLRNEKGEILTDIAVRYRKQTTIRECYEQLYTNKFDSLEKNRRLSRNIQIIKIESRRNS